MATGTETQTPRRYRNDPYSPKGYTPVSAPATFTTVQLGLIRSADAIQPAITPAPSARGRRKGGNNKQAESLVELCVGQVPHFVNETMMASFLVWVAPDAVLRRVVMAETRDGKRHGLCFVRLFDNGAAQKLVRQLHQRVWFGDDHDSVRIATNGTAVAELQKLHEKRVAGMDPAKPGDGMPLCAMTMEWSRAKCNDHVRHVPLTPTTATPRSMTPKTMTPKGPMTPDLRSLASTPTVMSADVIAALPPQTVAPVSPFQDRVPPHVQLDFPTTGALPPQGSGYDWVHSRVPRGVTDWLGNTAVAAASAAVAALPPSYQHFVATTHEAVQEAIQSPTVLLNGLNRGMPASRPSEDSLASIGVIE